MLAAESDNLTMLGIASAAMWLYIEHNNRVRNRNTIQKKSFQQADWKYAMHA